MTNRLLLGRSLSALATALIPTTLTLAVLRATGSAQDLGIVLAGELIPLLVFLPVAGVLADRLRPERVALLADLTRALTQAAIAAELLLGVNRVPDLAVLAAVGGVAIAFGMPAAPRLVVSVVPAEDRLRANARLGAATSLSSLAAPALAGWIALAAAPGWAAALSAALFTCSALTLGGVRTAAPPRARQAGSFGADLAEGWREIRARPWFLASVLGHGVWHFMAGLFLTLGPLIAVRAMGGEADWVMIVQSGTVGMVVGVFAAPRLPVRRKLAAVQVGAATFVLPMLALAVPLPAEAVAGAYFLAMFGLGVLSPLWETVVSEAVAEGALGRVRSFDGLISFASRPLGLAVAAPLAGVTGVTGLMVVGGLLVAVANLAALTRAPRGRDPAGAPGAAVHRGTGTQADGSRERG
ncbi:MAG TPA: MFS transporter [Nonomuraea sp.]|nr:MFS transporter [Nonomuraea sp.]